MTKLGSRKLHICPKVTKMGSIIGHRIDYKGVGGSESIIGHRIDYNGVGALREQRHIPNKNLPPTKSTPPGIRRLYKH